MVQANQAVWGTMDEEIRSYKGPPSLAITEHWNYEDQGKDFFGGYCYMSQGPLPQLWGGIAGRRARPVGRGRCCEEMAELQPSGRPEDRRRDAAAGAQPRHAGRRDRRVRPADPARDLFLVRQRQAADPTTRCGFMTRGLAARPARARSGIRTTTPAT